LRRPTLTEIDTVRRPPGDADVHPSVEVYDRVAQPMAFVLATDGFYAGQRDRIEAVAADCANRVFVKVPGGHNVHLLGADEVAAVVLDLEETSRGWKPS
jgi:hypothetical protein